MLDKIMLDKIEILLKKVETINEWVGRVISFLFLGLTFVIAFEVIMRYVLGNPTQWSWEMARQLFSATVLLGGGYTALHKGHVAIELFTENLSAKKRGLIELITSPIIYFALFCFIVWGGRVAWKSLLINEVTSGIVPFPLYTIKWMLVIGSFLMLLQMIVTSVRTFFTLTSKMKGTP